MHKIGKGLSIWDVYTSDSTVIEDGSTGQIACDSYHLYETDVQMLKSLNVRLLMYKTHENKKKIKKYFVNLGDPLPILHLVAAVTTKRYRDR